MNESLWRELASRVVKAGLAALLSFGSLALFYAGFLVRSTTAAAGDGPSAGAVFALAVALALCAAFLFKRAVVPVHPEDEPCH